MYIKLPLNALTIMILPKFVSNALSLCAHQHVVCAPLLIHEIKGFRHGSSGAPVASHRGARVKKGASKELHQL